MSDLVVQYRFLSSKVGREQEAAHEQQPLAHAHNYTLTAHGQNKEENSGEIP